MRLISSLLTLLALCMGPTTSAVAQDPENSRQSAGIAADVTAAEIALIPWAFIIKDELGEKTFVEVIRAAGSGNSISPDRDVFSVGFSKAAY